MLWSEIVNSGKCGVGMYSAPPSGTPPYTNVQRVTHFLSREAKVRPGLTEIAPTTVDIAHLGFWWWRRAINEVDSSMPLSLAAWAHDGGRIPVISWMPDTVPAVNGVKGMECIRRGLADSWIDAQARCAADLGFEIIIRFAHEMNGSWYTWNPWHKTGGEYDDSAGIPRSASEMWRWREAWRHVVARFRAAGANNVLWFWCPNFESIPNVTGNKWMDYYPGDAYVDIVGLDAYAGPGKTWDDVWNNALNDLHNLIPNKPLMIGETSQYDPADRTLIEANSAAVTARHTYVVRAFCDLYSRPYVNGILWFDQDQRPVGSSHSDYRFDAIPSWGNEMISITQLFNHPRFNPRFP